MRQVYNKTRSYLEWMAARIGASVTIVDDGDRTALAEAIRPNTRFVFAETFTNPLVRAQDFDMLREVIDRGRATAPALKLVLDTTIASPWAFRQPPLANGVDIIVASGTKSLGGNDRDLWGYLATNDTQFANAVMDLMAMRGGILDWRRAGAILAAFDQASDVARAPFGVGGEDCRIPRVASQGQRGLPSVAARASGRGGHPQTLRSSWLIALVPHQGRGRGAHAPFRRCAGHDGDRPLRACRSTGCRPRSTITAPCRNTSPHPIS